MTGDDIPANPSILNTIVFSNFAYINQLWVVAGLSEICEFRSFARDSDTALMAIRISRQPR